MITQEPDFLFDQNRRNTVFRIGFYRYSNGG